MPRTKAPKKKAIVIKDEVDEVALLLQLKEKVQNTVETMLSNFEDARLECKTDNKIFYCQEKNAINSVIGNKTVNEVKNLPSDWSNKTLQNNTQLDLTKTVRKTLLKRSTSCLDDDGYLTADSSSSDKRKSRAASKVANSRRLSRSLSRTSSMKQKDKTFKTPSNRNLKMNNMGYITPKMKPNTPQIVLRRPQQGEVALSMQGSPLFTGNVVTDSVANVNIPLNDGRLFTLQPQRGLRMSQVPELDPEIKNQLEIIRDNLNKVCALASRR